VIDPDLMRYLRDTGIPVEVCPTSNVCTGVVTGLEAHPVRALFDFGVRITLSSDDPTFFGTNINGEFNLLRNRFGFSDDDLARVARNGFEAAFVSDSRRKTLLRELDEYVGSCQATGI
jgi:adenosine deaminase